VVLGVQGGPGVPHFVFPHVVPLPDWLIERGVDFSSPGGLLASLRSARLFPLIPNLLWCPPFTRVWPFFLRCSQMQLKASEKLPVVVTPPASCQAFCEFVVQPRNTLSSLFFSYYHLSSFLWSLFPFFGPAEEATPPRLSPCKASRSCLPRALLPFLSSPPPIGIPVGEPSLALTPPRWLVVDSQGSRCVRGLLASQLFACFPKKPLLARPAGSFARVAC